MRNNVDCFTTVELTYFSAKFPNVCLYCGVDMDEDECDNWDMYPRCIVGV